MKKIVYKTNQAHPQIKAYKQAVERGNNSQHVLPKDGSWVVRRAGSPKVTRSFDTQSDAVDHARSIAQNQGTALFIHGRDGKIRTRQDY